MLEKLDFITPTTMKVLEFFFLNNMEEFHEREVIRRVEISKGSGNKILNKLAVLDFLKRTKRGRMVFYKLNMENPIIKQFKILENIFQLRELMGKLKGKSKKIVLFGSCSEGLDVKNSDIDIFIVADEKNSVKNEIRKFNEKNDRLISPIIVDSNELIELKKNDGPLYERIGRGIILWKRE